MDKTQNTASNVTEAADMPKPETKMAKCRGLLNEIKADAANLVDTSVRQEFIKRAISEIGMSKAGAITYYNNLNREAQGKPLYQKPKSAATTAQVQAAGEAEESSDEQAEEEKTEASAKAGGEEE